MINRLISLYWDIRYNLLSSKWKRSICNSRIDGLALMFHHVTDENIDINESCKCKISRFEDVLREFISEGRKFVTVDEMMNIIERKDNTKFAVITFDDVPNNFYYNAYPILKRLNLPFILFMTIDFIGKPGFLSKAQIEELDKDVLCTIGAHTMSHPMLRKVDNIDYELCESKRQLEAMLGHEVLYLAYPYGRQSSVSRKVMDQAKYAGYKCAFGTIQAPITDKTTKNMYYLPRIVKN